jgi:hypothetical protein
MTTAAKKNSSKTELFWDRFAKSGSIQAYLRFHKARQSESVDTSARPKAGSRAKAKKA